MDLAMRVRRPIRGQLNLWGLQRELPQRRRPSDDRHRNWWHYLQVLCSERRTLHERWMRVRYSRTLRNSWFDVWAYHFFNWSNQKWIDRWRSVCSRVVILSTCTECVVHCDYDQERWICVTNGTPCTLQVWWIYNHLITKIVTDQTEQLGRVGQATVFTYELQVRRYLWKTIVNLIPGMARRV